jgi:glucosylceramidase
MTRIEPTLIGLSIAFLIASCGSSGTGEGGAGGASDSGGAGSSSKGGDSGGSQLSSSAASNGGSSSNGVSSGGSQAVSSAAGNGGSGSSAKGGTGGGQPSSSAGGGTSASPAGGSSAGGTAGKGGAFGGSTSVGGSTVGTSTVSTSAVGGASGGTSSGGNSDSAGSTAAAEPKLITSGENAYWKNATWTEPTSGTADVTVNDGTTYQTWSGFGGTFNEAGWDAMAQLSASDRDSAIKMLFSATDGANFAYGRIPIGASDYAMDRYSLNENANDYAMDKFSIERDREKLIPYIKAALAIKPGLHLWGSPWTPPTWMKSGPFTENGKTGWDGGNMKDDAQVLKAHAIYLSKFVEEYGKEKITIEAVHPQNEPGYDTRYPSCLWTPALMTKFIGTYLGPTFAERGVNAQIYLGTMSNNEAGKDGTIVTTVLADATAMKYVKGCGLQWNMIDSTSTCANKGLQVVQSEHRCGNYPWNPGGGLPAFDPDKAQNDYAYGVESWGYIKDWLGKGVNVYSAWNMVLDTAGKNLDANRPWPQNALIVVDRTAKTMKATAAYYVFRHASQYVDPGAKRVATSGGDALAFKNPDGTLVAIVHNTATSAKTMTVKIGGKMLQFSVPANGFATVNPQ